MLMHKRERAIERISGPEFSGPVGSLNEERR